MKSLKLILSASLLSLVLGFHHQMPVRAQTVKDAAPTRTFFVRNYGNKCLDFSASPQAGSTPVVIAACNSSATQQVQVQEINARHEVILHVGPKVIGIHNPGASTGAVASSAALTYALELQTPAKPIDPAFRNQLFALDGDSILLASNRNLVAQVQNSRGANGTPVIVATRHLADAEFWDFVAIDGSDQDPTSGFIRASSRDTLLNAIVQVNEVARNNTGAAWGSVIKIIDTGAPIELSYNASV